MPLQESDLTISQINRINSQKGVVDLGLVGLDMPRPSKPQKYFGAKSQHGPVAFQRKVPETNCGPTSASMLGVGQLKGENTIAKYGNLLAWFRFLKL